MNFIKRILKKRKIKKIIQTKNDLKKIRTKIMLSGTLANLGEIDAAIAKHGLYSREATSAKVNLALIFLEKQFKHTQLKTKLDAITSALLKAEIRRKAVEGIKRRPLSDEYYHELLNELRNQFSNVEQYKQFRTAYHLIDSDIKAVMNRANNQLKK